MERNQKPVKKDKTMKITKSQLKEIVKQELKKVLAEQKEGVEAQPKPTYEDQINQLRDMLLDEIEAVEKRSNHNLDAIMLYIQKTYVRKPEPGPGPAIATGGEPKS
jgi:uncharacterized membrane protein YheB (UPF0754 family)